MSAVAPLSSRPSVGEIWRRKKGERSARVVGVRTGPKASVVIAYRYLSAQEGGYGRGRGIIRERTNTTSTGLGRFLERFVRATEGR